MAKGKRNQLISAVGFVITAIFIVLIFPREASFRYEYQQGSPWPHKDLIAPFDFPVLKTKEEMEADIKKIKDEIKLYYFHDTTSVNEGRNNLAKTIQQALQEKLAQISSNHTPINSNELILSSRFRRMKEKALLMYDSIFTRGILELNAELLNKPADYIIYVSSAQNQYEQHFTGEFYSLESALQSIDANYKNTDSIERSVIEPILIKSLKPTIKFDQVTTEKIQEEELRNLSDSKGSVMKGELIISKGQIINEDRFNTLESYRKEFNRQKGNMLNISAIVMGQLMFVLTVFSFLYFFLILFRKSIIRSYRKTFSILVLISIIIGLTRFAAQFPDVTLYVVPFTILPILIRSFYDTRLALFAHITTILLTAYFAPNNYEFMVLQLGAGITAIFSFVNFRKRAQLFTTVSLIFLTYAILFSALTLMKEGSLLKVNPYMYLWFFISCFATLFAFPMIYIFEKIFGLFSDITLLELSDTNTSLLRELSTKAPGTFQHSIQVANLAEAAIEEIGGNSLLIRTGALYHDIGKMVEPQYFIENQVSGINPHDGLSFDESARKIIEHVERGVEIARKHRLPSALIDFIRTHHGTQTVQYFYKNYVKTFPDAPETIKEKFSYPGPVPFSKETAVLMMADSVEAASRSIHEPNYQKLDELVEKIIDYQIKEKQYANSDITFKDISRIKQIFKKKLMNVYHVRIEYPE